MQNWISRDSFCCFLLNIYRHIQKIGVKQRKSVMKKKNKNILDKCSNLPALSK